VHAFSHDGPDATLESIAGDTGVGIGTLYRHFPTREALIEAAYRSELGKSGLKMVVIGLGAALIGFPVGRLFQTAGA